MSELLHQDGVAGPARLVTIDGGVTQGPRPAFERLDGLTTDPGVLARAREVLGPEADRLSDAEVGRLHDHADAMARVIVNMCIHKSE